jgi:dimethylamine/trimethylamine dehydrogenase
MGNIRARMIELGVNTVMECNVTGYDSSAVQIRSIYPGGGEQSLPCGSLVIVGNRLANDDLYQELKLAGVASVRSIGDCHAPGAIAHAVYSGHECARTIDLGDKLEHVERERPMLGLPT